MCGLCAQALSHVRCFATPRTIACQAPLSMGFSKQEYWSRLPFPPPGDLPKPGIAPMSLISPALAGRFFTTSAMWEALGHNRTLNLAIAGLKTILIFLINLPEISFYLFISPLNFFMIVL